MSAFPTDDVAPVSERHQDSFHDVDELLVDLAGVDPATLRCKRREQPAAQARLEPSVGFDPTTCRLQGDCSPI